MTSRRAGITAISSLFAAAICFLCLFLASSPAFAKVYIDITSPQAKKLPVAVFDLEGPGGNRIADIIRDDLTFTGFFVCLDKASFIESASQPFDPGNWTPLGVEAVVKGTVAGGANLTATVTLYDTLEGKAVFRKQYQAGSDLLRPLAHSIADDIYTALTGQRGVFRTKIAFVGVAGGKGGIYITDWDGRRMKKIGLRAGTVLSPHWSPDGTKIIYSAERGRQWSIYLLDFLRMTEKRVFTSAGINMAGDFFPNGNSFVFSSSRKGTPDLYTYSLTDGSVRRLTSSYGIEVSPAVSPDGRQIAFVSDRGGSPQIYVMNSDGTDIRRVTFEGSYNTSPSWSPAGDRIVFAGRRGGRNQIFTVKPDGSQLMQLTESGNNEDPSFSPDGRYITFSSDRDRTKGIYIMRANGESQKRITEKDLKALGPRWSPN
ncbi:MAG: Tol-Pal system beta propeller repeat protein TolB [Candidatus Sulfobium sp.]|jgi:TolB protein